MKNAPQGARLPTSGADRERRAPGARPVRTIPSSTSGVVFSRCRTVRRRRRNSPVAPGRSRATATRTRGPGPHTLQPSADARIIRAVDEADTAAPGKWAPAGRPVRPPAGVRTEKFEQDGTAEKATVEMAAAGPVSGARAGHGETFGEPAGPDRRMSRWAGRTSIRTAMCWLKVGRAGTLDRDVLVPSSAALPGRQSGYSQVWA